MYFHGYGGRHPPEEPPHGYGSPRDRHPPEEPPHFHRQEQSTMMQGSYQDPRPYLHQFPPQYDSSAFNQHNSHFPPDNFQYPPRGPPFWPDDAPPRLDAPPPPPPPPPPFPSFYPPQHESGGYPPAPSPHSAPYPPYYVPHTSSFGEHMQQQGQTQPHIYSSEAHDHRSSEFVHVSSFREQGGRSSVDRVPYHSSSPSVEEYKPLILQRGAVVAKEISPPANVELPNGQLVRVFCKHSRSFNLAVKDNRVLMVEADTGDEFQQWIRDDKYSIRVRDSYGHPAFMLINKGSKKALKHGMGKLQEVQLINYTPGIQDDDLFWTESQDFGEGFKTVRIANDTLHNLSVACGNNIENGSALILDTWRKKDNQLWKIFPL